MSLFVRISSPSAGRPPAPRFSRTAPLDGARRLDLVPVLSVALFLQGAVILALTPFWPVSVFVVGVLVGAAVAAGGSSR